MNNTDTRTENVIASAELRDLFASLNLTVRISEPIGEVRDNWPCIGFRVCIGSETFEWRMGIGHVDWKKAAKKPASHRLLSCDVVAVELVAKGKALVDRQRMAYLAALIAKAQKKVVPDPAEVLAAACRNGVDADEPFQNWCENFGYDEDSRKAVKIYNECTEAGKRARALVGHAKYVKFAELSARL